MSTQIGEMEVRFLPLWDVVQDHGDDEVLGSIEADIIALDLPVTFPGGVALVLNGSLLKTLPSIQVIPDLMRFIGDSNDCYILGVDNLEETVKLRPTITVTTNDTIPLGEVADILSQAIDEWDDAIKYCNVAEEQLSLAKKSHEASQMKSRIEAKMAGKPFAATPFNMAHCSTCGGGMEPQPDLPTLASLTCPDCVPF